MILAIPDLDISSLATRVASETRLSEESRSEIHALARPWPLEMQAFRTAKDVITYELEAFYPEAVGEEIRRAIVVSLQYDMPNEPKKKGKKTQEAVIAPAGSLWMGDEDKRELLYRINRDRKSLGLNVVYSLG